jgi:hypothetical protein
MAADNVIFKARLGNSVTASAAVQCAATAAQKISRRARKTNDD